jgi:hypothetical protein
MFRMAGETTIQMTHKNVFFFNILRIKAELQIFHFVKQI